MFIRCCVCIWSIGLHRGTFFRNQGSRFWHKHGENMFTVWVWTAFESKGMFVTSFISNASQPQPFEKLKLFSNSCMLVFYCALMPTFEHFDSKNSRIQITNFRVHWVVFSWYKSELRHHWGGVFEWWLRTYYFWTKS